MFGFGGDVGTGAGDDGGREITEADIVQLEGRQHFWHEGRHVGLVSASQILQCAEGKRDEHGIPVVLIRERDSCYGVAVERFLGERTLVVMPLDPRLGKVQDLSAGALLDDGQRIEREFQRKNFKEALALVDRIGALAEEEGHHPDLTFGWGYVTVSLHTHKIKGLHENDFIMAAKINRLAES